MKQKILFYLKITLFLLILYLQIFEKFIFLKFGTSPLHTVTKKVSYLNLLSVGYGNYFPVFTVLLTITTFFLFLLKKKSKRKFLFLSIILAATFNLLSAGLGMTSVNQGILLIEFLYILLFILFLRSKT